jgi:hypothetical protein
MQKYLFFLLFFIPFAGAAQKVEHDWENYIVSLNGRPVSINVDLGYRSLAPVPEDSFVVILRVKLNQTDKNGMPKQEESEVLLNMEDRLVEMLARQVGAKFTGRFTQRSIREFYFYAPDTLGYNKAVNQAMLPFGSHEWLAQAKTDKSWANYLEVLFPSEPDLLRIQTRRQVDRLPVSVKSGREPILVLHFLQFPSKEQMGKFLSLPALNGYELVSLPVTADKNSGKFELMLRRQEFLGAGWVESVVIANFRMALDQGGKYLGWNPDQQK